MQQKPSTDDYLDNANVSNSNKTIVIQPGSAKAVNLGTYDTADADPVYDVTISPDVKDNVGVSRERLDIPGERRYMLLYQFQNFSEDVCSITMHLRRQQLKHQ